MAAVGFAIVPVKVWDPEPPDDDDDDDTTVKGPRPGRPLSRPSVEDVDPLNEWVVQELPLLRIHRQQKFVMFSAMSTMTGGAGQNNYTAANAWMDAALSWAQPVMPRLSATAHRWGPVGGLGMRAKAFGSKDELITQEWKPSAQVMHLVRYLLAYRIDGTFTMLTPVPRRDDASPAEQEKDLQNRIVHYLKAMKY